MPKTTTPKSDIQGSRPEQICKGRLLKDLRDVWKVCLEILPLQKPNEQIRKTKQTKKNNYAHIEVLVTFLLVNIFSFWVVTTPCDFDKNWWTRSF